MEHLGSGAGLRPKRTYLGWIKTTLLVNGVNIAGLSLSELMDAFEYLGKVSEFEADRLEHHPLASISVKIITFDEWLYGMNDGGESDAR